MANQLPDFIARKLFVAGSLKQDGEGFVFTLNNSFAPVVVYRFELLADDRPISIERVTLEAQGRPLLQGDQISSQAPMPFSINLPIQVHVANSALPVKSISLRVDTRDAGEVSILLRLKDQRSGKKPGPGWHLPGWLLPALHAEAEIQAGDAIGEVHPFVYGQFIEHLERCIYGGLWSEDGSAAREDVFKLVNALKIPVIRYPGGNFASGYHWEDGIGPVSQRPERFDAAWSAPESNRVGTDEYIDLMRRLGAEPFLVVNDGSGTPEEAARWVEYCNATSGPQAERRAANGHLQPHNVRLWGIGNEVWGKWQIGSTDAHNYVTRLRRFAAAMRAVDASIRLVAVGNTIYSDDPQDEGLRWNEAVLREAGADIDDLSFHLYQPGQEGWQESTDQDSLHRTVCAAPLEAEQMIARMGAQLARFSPGRPIGVVFDEWNLWLTPPPEAGSMHQVQYTMRDALYCAGMLNVFLRQSQVLSMANLAQLVNVLPLVVTDSARAYATPMYWPFWMYQHMQPIALRTRVSSPCFNADALGKNVPARREVPYLDLAATRSRDGERLVLTLINRHPAQRMQVNIALPGFRGLVAEQAWLLATKSPLDTNSFEHPERVAARSIAAPRPNGDHLNIDLPAASVLLVTLACES